MSGRGLLDFLNEHRGAKILCIDEIDKLNKREQKVLYEFLETGKVLYTTGETRYNFTIPNIKILATGNSQRFTEPFISRFKPAIHLPEYTYDEFERVAIRLLRERYKIPAETSAAIARVVWEDFDSKDVRMLLHIGVLVRKSDTEQDIRRIIGTLMKYREGEEEYYD